MNLRPYQQKAIDDTRAAFTAGNRRVCYTLPTGGGKTVIFTWIATSMARAGKRICILVHREELIEQVSEALTSQGCVHGIIKAGYPENPGRLVQVASVFSLTRRLNRFATFDLIISDECHHAVAGSWETVCNHYAGVRLLGVTATPVRLDGRGLASAFDILVSGPTVPELIAGGYLVPPRSVYPNQLDLAKVNSRAGDYAKDDLVQILDTPTVYGDVVKYYNEIVQGRPSVAFCVTVEHAEHTARVYNQAGIPAVSIDGTLSTDERKRRINLLRNGRIKVLTSCDLISEGFDLPGIHAAILLRPTKSLSLYLQQVGRALRPAPGKSQAIILDHVGNVYRHGLPEWPREWELTQNRPKGDNPFLATCRECYAIYGAANRMCPVCGALREIAVAGGRKAPAENTAVKLSSDPISTSWSMLSYKETIRRAKTRQQLEQAAKARGYKPGWVRKMAEIKGIE